MPHHDEIIMLLQFFASFNCIRTNDHPDSFLLVLEFMSRDGVCIFKSIKRLGPAKSKDVINIVGEQKHKNIQWM